MTAISKDAADYIRKANAEMQVTSLSDRELDALIAEKVIGVSKPEPLEYEAIRHWSTIPNRGGAWYWDYRESQEGSWQPFFFSSDILAAMGVVEEMREKGWSFACTLYEGKLPYASFCKMTMASSRNAEADPLPRAICLAALAAIESSEP